MSTKAIRMVLSEMKKTHDWLMIDEAIQEVDAIERAAHLVTVVGQSEAHVERYDEWKAACELLRSIAKEAP